MASSTTLLSEIHMWIPTFVLLVLLLGELARRRHHRRFDLAMSTTGGPPSGLCASSDSTAPGGESPTHADSTSDSTAIGSTTMPIQQAAAIDPELLVLLERLHAWLQSPAGRVAAIRSEAPQAPDVIARALARVIEHDSGSSAPGHPASEPRTSD
jgi:hypothetical protein